MSDSSLPTPAELLSTGEVAVKGRMPWSSNATFLVEVCARGHSARAVYKPLEGERPLWDFPPGLYQREVASYELACALGWNLVPVTVARDDAPLGPGSLQMFVEADFDEHYFTLIEQETHHAQLRRICAFDILANSADRKAGHVLRDAHDHLWAVDNGLTFHSEFKLRTVIWEFGGDPIDTELLAAIEALVSEGLPDAVASRLDPFERDAVLARARALLREGCFPIDPTGRRYPWPLI